MRILFFLITLLSCQITFAQNQMYDICPLKVGATIPEANLVNAKNESIKLTNLVSQKPTVVVFYRGAWCGYCTKHLAELNDIKTDIEALGYQIVGITIDQSSKLAKSTAKAGEEIEVYSDAKLEATKAFGLDWKVDDALFDKYKTKYKLDLESWSGENHHSLTVPSIYVIKDKVVEFQYVNPNYKMRLKPATLLAVLKTL